MQLRRAAVALSSLYSLACNPEPGTSATEGSEGSSTSIASASTEPPTGSSGSGCILGSEGCACVDNLCLGDLECQNGVCTVPTATSTVTNDTTGTNDATSADPSTGTPEGCGVIVNGNIQIMNSAELEVLTGVQVITGNLQIAPNLGQIPQLACLEEVKTIDLNSGNDYSALQNLHTAEALTIRGGPDTIFPTFPKLEKVDYVYLHYVSDILSLPLVSMLKDLSLDASSAPILAEGISQINLLKLSQEGGDYSSLDGVVVDRMYVNSFMGDSLPAVSLQTNLDIFEAPNLVSVPVDFGEAFPSVAPISEDDENNARIYVHGTGLTNLNDFAGIATHRARPRFHANPQLMDVSGLSGSSVVLDFALAPNSWGIGISESPSLCKSTAQSVLGTMMLPAPPLLYGLNEQC